MNYDQFLREMTAIDGVTDVKIDTEPRKCHTFGNYVVTVVAIGQYCEQVTFCVKHPARSIALESAINLANALCNAPVL